MERLAAEGARFEYAFSPSACTAPSTASILTGRYPSYHTVGLVNGRYELHPATPTVATILGERGFRTGAIVANPVLRAGLGLDAGFETYDDNLEKRELNRVKRERTADRVVDLAEAWLDAADDRPFLLWLHFQDPHGPYAPPEGWDKFHDTEYRGDLFLPAGVDHSGHQAIPKYQVFYDERRSSEYERRYDSEIAFFDHQLGRLLDGLDDRGLRQTTLIVLTADHGEAMGEDDFYFGHGHSVGLDQVRVPLIISGPGVPVGREVSTPVSNVMVAASILDALGLEAPEGVDRSSFLEVLRHRGEQREPVFFETPNQSGTVFANTYMRHDRRPASDQDFWSGVNPNTRGFWKPLGTQVIRQLDPDRPSNPPSFTDRVEALLVDFDSRASNAREDLAPMRVAAERPPAVVEQLRVLGYVQ
jgi:arylsulfatase